MKGNLWTLGLFYGNVILMIIVFFILVDRRRLKELIPIGLVIAVENYTLETLGLHYGYWEYPLTNPGYPEVVVISSLIYFPIIAMLFYQYLAKSFLKNVLLIGAFVTGNMILEVIAIKTTNLFVYQRNMNLFIAFLVYIWAYLLIMGFGYFYRKLD